MSPGYDETHFSASIGGANQREFSTDAIRPFILDRERTLWLYTAWNHEEWNA